MVSVDNYGKVSGISVGTVTVTVTTSNGKTATASVTVLKKPVPVESITLLPLGIELFEGETAYAVAQILPQDADDKSVTFVSSDTSVATVNEKGLVTAVGEGSATIKAVASNGKAASIPVTVRSMRLEESHYEYYYTTLSSDREKVIYEALRDAMASCLVDITEATTVYAADQEPEIIERIFRYVLLDHPEFFHVDTEYSRHSVGGVTTHISLSYNLTSAEYEMALDRLSRSLEALFDEIKKVSSESERAMIAYNYVKDRLIYDKSDLGRACHMYNAFISGKAVCEGYSKLFGYILKKAGITCLQATGDISDGGHQWTMAMLNGNWYHFDPTWDDPITATERPEGVLDLNYFAVPDDIIYDTRTAHERDVLPEAYHLDENYYVKNRLFLVDLSTESMSAVARRADNLIGHIALLCSPAVYEKLTTDSSYLWLLVGYVADDATNVSYVHNEHSQVVEIFYK